MTRRTVACALTLVLLVACNDRFEFDVPSAVAGAAGNTSGGRGEFGGSASAGDSGALAAGTAGNSGGGGGTSGAGPASCGAGAACPAHLRCVEGGCRECATATDCTDPMRPICSRERGRCVACAGAADCPDDFACDEETYRCLRRCEEETECPASAHSCDERRGVCIQCDGDRECIGSALGPHCASDGGSCAACHDDDDCTARRCDVLTGKCVDCVEDGDCSSERCDTTVGSCIP